MFTTTTFGKQKWMMKINKNKNKKMNLQEIFFSLLLSSLREIFFQPFIHSHKSDFCFLLFSHLLLLFCFFSVVDMFHYHNSDDGNIL